MSDGSILPYGRQWVSEDDAAALGPAALCDFLTTGPEVTAFEEAVAEAAGTRHAVAVSSGTAALHVAYHALGLRRGMRIVTSPLTFAATANAALYLGAEVRFADVDPRTGNLDPAAVDDALADGGAHLLVSVDLAGIPVAYDALSAVAKKHGARYVSDAAHSLGARYRDAPVGSLADASTFSFHPVKTVTTGEGGAIVTDDADVAREASEFRSHGLVRAPERMRKQDEGAWFYEQQTLGFNYRITDLQCALGVRQMRHLERFVTRRREIARAYDAAFAALPCVELPFVPDDTESAFHLYVLRVREPERRRAFFDRLRALGLGVQVHYIPVYLHPYYQDLGYAAGSCPVAESYYRRAVSIPMFPRMTDSDVATVIDRVHTAVREVL